MTPVAVPTTTSHQTTRGKRVFCVCGGTTAGRLDVALCRPLVASLCFVLGTGRAAGA